MRVYVETNFVLELVYRQEQYPPADELLQLVEAGHASLHLPVFAVAEAMSTAARRAIARQELVGSVQQERDQLGRSNHRRSVTAGLTGVAEQLAGINADDGDRLDATLTRLLDAAAMLPLDKEIHARAQRYRADLDLTRPDAIVLASVVADLSGYPPGTTANHLFISRDVRGFSKRQVRAELATFACDHVGGFDGALSKVRATLGRSPGPLPPGLP